MSKNTFCLTEVLGKFELLTVLGLLFVKHLFPRVVLDVQTFIFANCR